MLEIDLKSDYSERVHYNLPNMPVFISRTMIKTFHNLTVECHWHDDIEFFLIVSGKLKYNVNGESIDLKKGEGLFVNSRQMHYGYSIGENECDCICVIIHPILICMNKYIEQTFINPIINNNIPYILLTGENQWTDEIYNNVYGIYEAFNQKEKNHVLIIQSLFYRIWSLLYGNMPLQVGFPHNFSSNKLVALKEMVSFIHTHYNEKISISDIASAGNVCQSRCCDIFKEFIHQTPIGYLTSYRLGKGIVLLEKTSMPITEIAISIGFTGASYFAESFRKHYYCTPSEFRNRIAKVN